MKPASFGAQLKHTFLNSSQSHPISVKLEKKRAANFIILLFFTLREFFLSRKRKKKNHNQSNFCAAIAEKNGRNANNEIKRFYEHFMCEILIVL